MHLSVVMVWFCPVAGPGTPQSSVPPFLGLSPSLRSSPVDDVTVGGVVPPGKAVRCLGELRSHMRGQQSNHVTCLLAVLFEEVQICCSSPVQVILRSVIIGPFLLGAPHLYSRGPQTFTQRASSLFRARTMVSKIQIYPHIRGQWE